MKVLVTGATGFTGGALTTRLLELGHDVRAIVRPGSASQELSDMGVELTEGHLTDKDFVSAAVAGCEKVYHIAAVFRTAGHPDSYYYDINRDGTDNLLQAARKHGCERFVHCSTAGVHGHIPVELKPADETCRYNPGDIYQESKLAGEKVAQQAIADGQPVVIFRPGAIFGPGDMRLLKLFKTVHQRRFRMFGDGTPTFHFVYIDDLIDGILLCGQKPEALGEIFLLVGNQYIPLNEVVRLVSEAVGVQPPQKHLPLTPLLTAAKVCETICKPLGIDPPLYMRRCEFFIKHRAFTNEKARRLLGWMPKVDPQEGIRRTAAWYFNQGLLKGEAPEVTRQAGASSETVARDPGRLLTA